MNDIIELEDIITQPGGSDDIGDIKRGETYFRRIYAKKKSISQNEFYQAQAHGFKIELKFEINKFEYEDNEKIRYKGKIYKIFRTFELSEDKMEIVCIGSTHGDS